VESTRRGGDGRARATRTPPQEEPEEDADGTGRIRTAPQIASFNDMWDPKRKDFGAHVSVGLRTVSSSCLLRYKDVSGKVFSLSVSRFANAGES